LRTPSSAAADRDICRESPPWCCLSGSPAPLRSAFTASSAADHKLASARPLYNGTQFSTSAPPSRPVDAGIPQQGAGAGAGGNFKECREFQRIVDVEHNPDKSEALHMYVSE